MRTKLDKLKAAAAANDWRTAIGIAARFPRLDEHKCAILRAHQAAWHPAWAKQLRRDPEADVAAGIAALKERYRIG